MIASYLWTLDHVKEFSLHGVTVKKLVNVLSSTMVVVMETKTDILQKQLVRFHVHQNAFCHSFKDHAEQQFQFGVTAPLKESAFDGPMEAVKEMKTDMQLKKNVMLHALTRHVSGKFEQQEKF